MNTELQAKIESLLVAKQIPFKPNHSLSRLNSFRIGGNARIFAEPETLEQLIELQKIVIQNDVPFFFLGGGSNILISDHGFQGIVIYMAFKEGFEILSKDEQHIIIKVLANTRAPWFAKQVSKLEYQGLEFLTTIPGHIGGAIMQNAGCYGSEICEFIDTVEYIEGGKPVQITSEEAEFSYRNSMFKENPPAWIYSMTVRLAKGEREVIQAKIQEFSQRRLNSQPKNRRSAGSIFKNPRAEVSTKKAWQLIDESGLRGVMRNAAEISREHCNFIVNNGGAKAEDVYFLARLIEKEVLAKTKVKLEREVVFIGDFRDQ